MRHGSDQALPGSHSTARACCCRAEPLCELSKQHNTEPQAQPLCTGLQQNKQAVASTQQGPTPLNTPQTCYAFLKPAVALLPSAPPRRRFLATGTRCVWLSVACQRLPPASLLSLKPAVALLPSALHLVCSLARGTHCVWLSATCQRLP